jgi:hypothetical protein
VAMEAFEHFTDREKTPSISSSPGMATGEGFAPPPPPGAANLPSVPPIGVPVPPPVGGPPLSPSLVTGGPPPGPPVGPQTTPTSPGGQSNAVLLIRAMIAAANADGVIDEQERANILGKLQAVGLSDEEKAFIVQELQEPKSLDGIVAQVTTEETARQVYMASLMAIEVDTEAEQIYLQTLARQLNLNATIVEDIHRQTGTAIF